MAKSSLSLAFVLSLGVAGCSATVKTHAPTAEIRVASHEPRPLTPHADNRGAVHAVLAHDGHAYVLTGQTTRPARFESTSALEGGWTLHVNRRSDTGVGKFTLVGPSGSCIAAGVARAEVNVDYGGASSATLPGPTYDAIVLEGCAELAKQNEILLALDGEDDSARWEPLAHLDDEAAPTDRTFGEDEVWIHRYGLPGSDIDVVERTVVRYAAPACIHEEHRVILETEDGHPLADHAGFSLRGALRTQNGALLVLTGVDDPEALRIVPLSQTESESVLDARLGLLADAGGSSC